LSEKERGENQSSAPVTEKLTQLGKEAGGDTVRNNSPAKKNKKKPPATKRPCCQKKKKWNTEKIKPPCEHGKRESRSAGPKKEKG